MLWTCKVVPAGKGIVAHEGDLGKVPKDVRGDKEDKELPSRTKWILREAQKDSEDLSTIGAL